MSLLYKSLVRPILEYAASVWSPYLVKDTVLLEKFLRRASRLETLGQKRGEIQYELCHFKHWPNEDDISLLSSAASLSFLSIVSFSKITSN